MLTNLQARDVATVLHPYTNLASLPQTGTGAGGDRDAPGSHLRGWHIHEPIG